MGADYADHDNDGIPNGTHYAVETSSTMAPETWSIVPIGCGPDTVTLTGNDVMYTFPSGIAKFARLRVGGP